MRIAFVVHGPCAPAVEELAIALLRARHAVAIIGDEPFEAFGRRADGVERIVIGGQQHGPASSTPDSVNPAPRAAEPLAAARRLGAQGRQVLRHWRPDVVHAVGFTAGLAAHIAVGGDVPIVQSMSRLAVTERRLGSLSTALTARMLLERRILDRASMIIADSAGQAMEVLRAGVLPSRVVTVTPAVDWHRYPVTPLPRRRSDRPWCLLHPGGSLPESGVEDAMAAISSMGNVHLTIVGVGSEQVATLRTSARRWRLQERISMHPAVPGSAMPAMYVAADAVIVPPRQLSSGRLVLEGLSCGRPVIATACGGILDLIVDGRTGFLAPPRDPAGLASAVRRAMTAPRSVLEEMVLEGVTEVRQEHAWQQRLSALTAVYDAVTSSDIGTGRLNALVPA